MRVLYLALAVIALFSVVIMAVGGPCLADGEDPPTGGDPYEIPPGYNSGNPTPCVLSDFWMIVMAMAFQLAL